MLWYNKITSFENARRRKLLTEFRQDVLLYFRNSTHHRHAHQRTDEPQAIEARQRLNHRLREAHDIIQTASIPSGMTYVPPRIAGGPILHFDLLLNMFELSNYEVPSSQVIDIIDRAVGVYEQDFAAARFRTFNPFWWLLGVFVWFGRLPFVFLAELGFGDANTMEKTIWGRITKGAIQLLTTTATILALLNYLGLLDRLKTALELQPQPRVEAAFQQTLSSAAQQVQLIEGKTVESEIKRSGGRPFLLLLRNTGDGPFRKPVDIITASPTTVHISPCAEEFPQFHPRTEPNICQFNDPTDIYPDPQRNRLPDAVGFGLIIPENLDQITLQFLLQASDHPLLTYALRLRVLP